MTPKADYAPYDSLAEMKIRHAELLRTSQPGETAAQLRARVVEFLGRGAATGLILDCPTDRRVAQGMLDYWKATLYTQLREGGDEPARPTPVDTVLADFPEGATIQVVAKAEKAILELPREDLEIAQRIMRRLVRLEPATREFRPSPVLRASLDDVGNVGQVARVIHSLESSGVLQIVPSSPPGNEQVELAALHMIRTWPRYADWLKDRLALRTAAYLWQQQNRHSSSLISGSPLAEANTFRDLDALETEFVEESHKAEERARKIQLWGGVGALVVTILVLIVIVVLQNRNHQKSEEISQINQQSLEAKDAFEAAENEWKLTQARNEVQQKENAARVTNINRMIRALTDIVVADKGEYDTLAKWQWEDLKQQLQTDPFLRDFLKKHEQELNRLMNEKGIQKRGPEALAIAHAVRNWSIEANDKEVIAMMKSVREVVYRTADRVVNEIADAARKGRKFNDVAAYRREFWRLYWGALGMVESEAVESAMVEFGKSLDAWEKESQATNGTPSKQTQDQITRAATPLVNVLRAERGTSQPIYAQKR